MPDRNRQRNFRVGRSESGGFVRMRRKGPKPRRQSSAMLLFVALAIAVLILGFVIRRITQPAPIRYVVPPHPPANVVQPPEYSPDDAPPPAGPDARNNGPAALAPPQARDGAAPYPGEQLTPEDRQRLDTLIQRKMNQ